MICMAGEAGHSQAYSYGRQARLMRRETRKTRSVAEMEGNHQGGGGKYVGMTDR